MTSISSAWMTTSRPLRVCHIPYYVPYGLGLYLQETLVARRAKARAVLREAGFQHTMLPDNVPSTLKKSLEIAQTDFVLLLQHTPVYTLGRRNDTAITAAKLSAPNVDIFQTRRGGLLTYHGPGQLVAYPIFDLGIMNLSTRCYVSRLQDVIRKTLAHNSIQLKTIDPPSGDSKYTGVWIDPTHKIASIGVQVQHRLTSHGIALNVSENALDGFRKIVACGLPDVHLTCIDEQLTRQGRTPYTSVQKVAEIMANEFGATFSREIQAAEELQYVSATKSNDMKVLSHIMLDGKPMIQD